MTAVSGHLLKSGPNSSGRGVYQNSVKKTVGGDSPPRLVSTPAPLQAIQENGVIQITDKDAFPSVDIGSHGFEFDHKNDMPGIIQNFLPAILTTGCHYG